MRLCVSLLTALALAACIVATERHSLPPVLPVDKIVVEMPRGKSRRSLDDPEVISTIMAVTNRYLDDWGTPWYGPPIPRIRLLLFRNGVPIESVGLGDGFLTRGDLDLLSRTISYEESARLFDLVEESATERLATPYDKPLQTDRLQPTEGDRRSAGAEL